MTTNVTKKIHEKICRYYGHVKRKRNDRLPKLLINMQPDGRNTRRHTKKKRRGKDNLKAGLERYDLKNIVGRCTH